MHKKFVVAVVFAILTSVLTTVQAQDPSDPKDALFMKAKLEHSKKVLEGLIMEDFDAIAKSAQEMSLLTLAEEWRVLSTVEYHEHSRAFRRAADNITKAAKEKNLDGATLAYMQATMKCIECHKHVKHVREASFLAPR